MMMMTMTIANDSMICTYRRREPMPSDPPLHHRCHLGDSAQYCPPRQLYEYASDDDDDDDGGDDGGADDAHANDDVDDDDDDGGGE
jgi:hypothetical protein